MRILNNVHKFWTPPSAETHISGRLLLKMALPFVTVGVILLAAGTYGAWRVHRLHKRGADILENNVSSIRAAEELEVVVREMRYRLKQFLLTKDPGHLEKIQQQRPQLAHWLSEAERLGTTSREQQLIDRLKRGRIRFFDTFDQILDHSSQEIPSQTVKYLAHEVLPNKILVTIQKYVSLNEDQVSRSSERNQQTANRLVFGLLLLGTCGGIAGLLTGYGIARGISRTLVQLSFPIRNVAGKLNEVVGPLTVSADPGFEDLEVVLQKVSQRVATVVERLQQSQQEALRAEQLAAVGQLAAGLAHELRNPLTSMKIIVQSAVDHDQPERLDGRDLAVLEEEIARLEQSVQTFLDFARPPELEKREVELQNVVEQTITLASQRAKTRGVELSYEPPQEPIHTEADIAQIRQVVLNLLLNALDAVPNGGKVIVELDLERPEDQNLPDQPHWGIVRVSDSGCGLPAELGDRIFEPFISTKETGIGLGLSICNSIIEAHGGEIRAENQSGGGAVFTVRLPLQTQNLNSEVGERGLSNPVQPVGPVGTQTNS